MLDTITRFFDACQPFSYPLLACSIILLTAILYRLLFTGHGAHLRRMEAALAAAGSHSDAATEALEQLCARDTSPLAQEALFLLRHRGAPNLPEQMEARLRLYVDSQRTGMATISVVTNIAPMLGILGTAWGLVQIFGVFGGSEAGPGIAMGISTALYTTIFGLAVAVPGIIALTCFERGLERRAAQINRFFTDLLALCGR